MVRIVDPEEREVEALKRLTTFQGMNVLDVGCGEGRTARTIARTAASVIGIDPDPDRIALARDAPFEEGSCAARFRIEDAVTIDFSSREFDAVIFTRSL